MGLVDLKTDLKSLKFGNDRIYGGDSKQPYIQTPIPERVGELGFLNEDFILRGGSKAFTNSALDVLRLGKYFIDIRNPNGLLFIAKQNLLSRTAVQTQASGRLLNEGVYTPLSTLLQAGGNAFGLHVNKQGLNPFNGPGSLTTYSEVKESVTQTNTNRLVNLYNKNQSSNFKTDPVNVLVYPGGPGSILGIGKTRIKFADQRTGVASGKDLKTYQSGLGESGTDRSDIRDQIQQPLGLSEKYKDNDLTSPLTTNTLQLYSSLSGGDFYYAVNAQTNSQTGANNPGYGKNEKYLSGLDNSSTDRSDIPEFKTNFEKKYKIFYVGDLISKGTIDFFREEKQTDNISNVNIPERTSIYKIKNPSEYLTKINTNPTDRSDIDQSKIQKPLGVTRASKQLSENTPPNYLTLVYPSGSDPYYVVNSQFDSLTGNQNPLASTDPAFFYGSSHTRPTDYLSFYGNYFEIPTSEENITRFLNASNKYPETVDDFNKVYDPTLIKVYAQNDPITVYSNGFQTGLVGQEGYQAFENSNGTNAYTQGDIQNISTAVDPDKPFWVKNSVNTTPRDFRKVLKETQNQFLTNAPDYGTKNIEQRVGLGDPGGGIRSLTSYTNGAFNGASSPTSFDIINASKLYQSTAVKDGFSDLVKFRIGVLDNDKPSKKTYIHFRAFLDQISDSYNADWSGTRYIGRGENFYTYNGFDRKVSLSWTVAAQSKIELIPMYKRLNYLASICTPDYSSTGYMRGNIVTLTIGGYFYEQPGIITGFSYEMNDDNSSWEIGISDDGEFDNSVKELPHRIKVNSFNFIPIHTFVPRKQYLEFGDDDFANKYGPERYIALDAGSNNNYGEVAQRPAPQTSNTGGTNGGINGGTKGPESPPEILPNTVKTERDKTIVDNTPVNKQIQNQNLKPPTGDISNFFPNNVKK